MKRLNLSLILIFLASTCSPSLAADLSPSNNLDSDLTSLLQHIEDNQLKMAIESSELLLVKYPSSSAIQLVYADLRNMLAHQNVSMAPTENYSLNMLKTVNELIARLKHSLNEPSAMDIPTNLLKVGADTQHIIAVDLGRSRLYLLERNSTTGQFQIREHHYASIGLGGSGKHREGDLRTPIGIYNINGFKPDNKLPKLYGSGAFTLNYPNSLDTLSDRTGSGIWLHGMPHEQLSRPPQDSEGCIVIQNDLIKHLLTLIDRSTTPVLLSEALLWHPVESIDTSILTELQSAISLQYPPETQPQVEEFLRLPKGSPSPVDGLVYRVRFLLHDYSEPSSSTQVKTQYWWKNTNDMWSLLSEEE